MHIRNNMKRFKTALRFCLITLGAFGIWAMVGLNVGNKEAQANEPAQWVQIAHNLWGISTGTKYGTWCYTNRNPNNNYYLASGAGYPTPGLSCVRN